MASAPSETPTSIAPGGVPSRNALKKEAKKAEKAEKARIRAAAQAGSSAAAVDLASDNYGDLSPIRSSTDRTSERRVRFKNLPSDENTPVIFRARVHNARVQSTKLAFLVLRQQSETIQCVVAANEECTVSKQMVKWAGGISSESIVLVHGLVKKVSPPIKSATISDLEIHAQKVYVLSGVHVRLPIQVDDASRPEPSSVDSTQQNESLSDDSNRPFVSLKTKLDHRVISLRSPVNHAIFRIRSGLVALFREFLSKENFIEVSTPKLLATATEGGSDVFEVKYFGSKAYLAQSPQLYKQMLIAADMERVFEVAPVFRAENSNTHRHMTEFVGLDLEMAFEEHYHEVLELLEKLFIYIFRGLKERFSDDIEVVRKQYPVHEFKIPEVGKVLRLSFAEGVRMLVEDKAVAAEGNPPSELGDLNIAQEKRLGELIHAKYGEDFYVLDNFPLALRPFYAMPSPTDPQLSNAYDIFIRGEEIMSGGQRIHDPKLLEERMRSMNPPIDPDSDGLRDYVEAFRYGAPLHGGGGIGLERFVFLYLGIPNIRMASAFPRDPHRLRP